MKLYFTMAHTPNGVKRIGNPHRSLEAAKSWVPFVRGAWHSRVTVRSIEVTRDADGNPTQEFLRRMDEEFNMDVTTKGTR